MATIKCSACETNPSITFCSETGVALCGDCAIPCDRCHVPLARTRVQVTSKGRKLCPRCMAERNAKRQARREQIKEKSRARKRAEQGRAAAKGIEAPVARQPVTPGPLGSNASTPGGSAPVPSPISFEALNASQGPQATPPAAPAAKVDFGADFGAPAAPDEDAGPKRGFGLEGVPTDASSRLELPPIDENRPVMTHSGYQAPTKTAYFFAFLFFGIAGLVFYSSTPILKDVLFPFDTPAYEFNAGRETLIMDTNRLRDTGNISQFEILAQAPTFFIAWLILIVYVGGSALILFSTARSAIASFLAKRRLRKVEKKDKSDPFSSLSGH